MLYTSEARWFFKGGVPDLVEAWFVADSDREPEARTDRYLVFPGCDSVGVKLRDANDHTQAAFEVKALLRGPHVARLGPQARARVDEWVKWSAPLDSFPSWAEAVLSTEPTWVAVHKRRRQRKFSVDDDKTVEVDVDDRPDEGATFDLVTLQTGGEAWWTIGLESFGSAHAVGSNLLALGRTLLAEPAQPELEIVQSLSYATWAAALVPDIFD